MARFWLGPIPWQTVTDPDGVSASFYAAPAGTLGWIDLRSPAQCAVPNSASGFGFFTTATGGNLGASYTNLGTDIEASLTNTQRNSLASALALPQTPSTNVLGGIIYEALTLQSDPTGLDRCLPLTPAGRNFEVWLAGVRIRNAGFDTGGPEAGPYQDLLRRQIKRIYQDGQNGICPADQWRKVMGYLVRQLGINYQWTRPQDGSVPDQSDLPPTTTITDDFNRSNNTNISTGGPLTYTEVTGDFQISSNGIIGANGSAIENRARAETDLSSADHYSQINITATPTVTSRYLSPCTRFNSGADTCYSGNQFAGTTTGSYRLNKVVTGTLTALGTGTTQTIIAVKKLSSNGTSHQLYTAGSSVETITDSAISSNLRCGFGGNLSSATVFTLDDFEAGDLSVGGGLRVDPTQYLGIEGVAA